jgi:hypothetical protein
MSFQMSDNEKIRLLESALFSYITRHGFTPEARDYFMHNLLSSQADGEGSKVAPASVGQRLKPLL